MILKTKRFWKLLFLGACILFLGYFLFVGLVLVRNDYSSFNRYDWPRNLEYNSLFWIGMCMAAVEVQILFACAAQWIRLLRNRPQCSLYVPRTQAAWL